MWISTKDRIPTNTQSVLWANKDRIFIVGTLSNIKKILTKKDYKSITCWAPLKLPIGNMGEK